MEYDEVAWVVEEMQSAGFLTSEIAAVLGQACLIDRSVAALMFEPDVSPATKLFMVRRCLQPDGTIVANSDVQRRLNTELAKRSETQREVTALFSDLLESVRRAPSSVRSRLLDGARKWEPKPKE